MKQPALCPFSQKLKESEQFETNQLNIHDSTAKIVIECLAKQLEKHDAPLAEFMKSNAHFDIAAGRNRRRIAGDCNVSMAFNYAKIM